MLLQPIARKLLGAVFVAATKQFFVQAHRRYLRIAFTDARPQCRDRSRPVVLGQLRLRLQEEACGLVRVHPLEATGNRCSFAITAPPDGDVRGHALRIDVRRVQRNQPLNHFCRRLGVVGSQQRRRQAHVTGW